MRNRIKFAFRNIAIPMTRNVNRLFDNRLQPYLNVLRDHLGSCYKYFITKFFEFLV